MRYEKNHEVGEAEEAVRGRGGRRRAKEGEIWRRLEEREG